MSGCIVKEVIDVVVDVVPLACRKMCDNISNCIYLSRVDDAVIEEEYANDLLAVDDLLLRNINSSTGGCIPDLGYIVWC